MYYLRGDGVDDDDRPHLLDVAVVLSDLERGGAWSLQVSPRRWISFHKKISLGSMISPSDTFSCMHIILYYISVYTLLSQSGGLIQQRLYINGSSIGVPTQEKGSKRKAFKEAHSNALLPLRLHLQRRRFVLVLQ